MEKLWTTTEAAQYLGLTESELGQLVQEGKLTGYKLGGKFLRFRPDQVKALKPTLSARRTASAHAEGMVPRPGLSDTGRARHQFSPAVAGENWQARLRDFVYFYDLYLVSGGLLAGLVLYLIASGG